MPNQYTLVSTKVPCACAQCGARFLAFPSRVTQGRLHFCSRQCHADWKYAQAVASVQEPQATRLPNGCLIFNGWKNERGYGRVRAGGTGHPAHTFAWEVANGRSMPDGMIGCHTCPGGDNPSCVEPTHIWPGTNAENNADAARKGRLRKGSQHPCSKLTEDDVRDIRSTYDPGVISQQTLAFEYGVSQVLIGKIVRREVWTHV